MVLLSPAPAHAILRSAVVTLEAFASGGGGLPLSAVCGAVALSAAGVAGFVSSVWQATMLSKPTVNQTRMTRMDGFICLVSQHRTGDAIDLVQDILTGMKRIINSDIQI
jgi:hypothetical protein